MGNKLIIFILIIIVILCGGLGYYAYNLGEHISYLNALLVATQQQQAGRIDSLNDELAAFRGESSAVLDSLKGDLDATRDDLDTEIAKIITQFSSLQTALDETRDEVAGTQGEIDNLQADLKDVTGFSESVINAREVFRQAREATVQISNGERTIGSGFLYDDQRHVVTAHHVIENLANINVIFSDGSIMSVTGKASNAFSDVAVLTLGNQPAATPLTLAATQPEVGEPVVAIGNPYDLTETLTAGVVSQTDRFVEINDGVQSRYTANLIQFDAAANPGNSGGALLNAHGELAGMVVAGIRPQDGSGIYYAVSIDKIKKVAASLIENGYFDYPWLGINVADLTPDAARDRGLSSTSGVIVTSLPMNSPSRAAGMEANDIITGIDGQNIRNLADLNSYLGVAKSPDDTATIDVLRDGSPTTITVTVGTRPS